MGKKDLWQSDYFDNNDRFADLFNGVLFHGKEIIKSSELENADSTLVHHFPNQNPSKIICDKIRKWKGQYLSVFILENQSYIDYGMVLRAIKEEAIAYEVQRKHSFQEAKRRKYSFTNNEFLSGMKKNQKFIPVITLILYLGTEEKWDGARTLYELLDIDDALKPFVTNYRLNIFDYHDLNDFSFFKTENKLLFELLSNFNNKHEIGRILLQDSRSRYLDKETASAISGIIGEKIDLNSIREFSGHKEVYNMCKAWEEIKNDARNEGLEEGISQGISQGHLEEQRKNLDSLMRTLNFTLEQALDALDIPIEDRKRYYS